MDEYKTFDYLMERIPYFIEEIYNKKRLYSSLATKVLKNLNINLILKKEISSVGSELINSVSNL